MHMFFRSCILSFISLALGVAGADETLQPTSAKAADEDSSKWVANSEVELTKLVFSAIDNEQYEGLQKLLVPVALHRELVVSEEDRKSHVAYYKQLPEQAEQYRAFLDYQKILPLTGSTLRRINTDRRTSVLAGKKVRHNRGIWILKKLPGSNEVQHMEVIDWAIEIEGRWYVRKLVIDLIEGILAKTLKIKESATSETESGTSESDYRQPIEN